MFKSIYKETAELLILKCYIFFFYLQLLYYLSADFWIKYLKKTKKTQQAKQA